MKLEKITKNEFNQRSERSVHWKLQDTEKGTEGHTDKWQYIPQIDGINLNNHTTQNNIQIQRILYQIQMAFYTVLEHTILNLSMEL